MRKILSLALVVALMSTVSFGQVYSSKQNAKDGVQQPVATKSYKKATNNRNVNTAIFSEDFEAANALDSWTLVDSDTDGSNWLVAGAAASPLGHESAKTATSASWNQSALTPDNWLITPAIDLTSAGVTTTLEFWRKAQDQTWPAEKYTVYLSTSGNTVADFTGENGHVIQEQETVTNDDWQKRTIGIGAYVGGTVYIAFRHHDCTDNFRLNIDDVSVFENTSINAGITEVSAPSNASGCALTATEDVTIKIFNYGGAEINNFDVSYTINGGTPVTETVTTAIAPVSEGTYTFTTKADLSTLGYYTIKTSVALTDDEEADNNEKTLQVTNGDASLVVDVSTDAKGGQAWFVINSANDTIARHGAYQWNLTNDITTVCLIADDCYKFSWISGNPTSTNTVVLKYNDSEIYNQEVTASFLMPAFGGNCAADEIKFEALLVPNVVAKDTDVPVKGKVTSYGTSQLTSFDVVYTINGGTPVATYTVSGLTANTGDNVEFTHDVPWHPTEAGQATLEVTISNPNGNVDGNDADNVQTKDIAILNEIFPKTVVYEEGTGTWCGWCVRGLVGLKDMAHNVTDGSWIGIAVHNGDPMQVDEYNSALGVSGYPSGKVNRFSEEVDPGLANLQAAYAAHKAVAPVAKIEITGQTWDASTRAFTVDVASIFALDIPSANYNAALIVVEDSVRGTGSGFDQANYYNANGIDMIDWEGVNWKDKPNPIPAAQMVYDHVGRQLIGGHAGVAGSIPTSVTYNTPNNYTFSGTIPVNNNEKKTHYVAIIIDNATGTIVNATKVDVEIPSGIVANSNADFRIYPNPSTGMVNVKGVEGADIVVYNMLGQVVFQEANASENASMDLSALQAGNYIVKVIKENKIATQKLVLTK